MNKNAVLIDLKKKNTLKIPPSYLLFLQDYTHEIRRYIIINFFLHILKATPFIITMIVFFFCYRSKAFNRFIFSMACPGKYNPWNVLKVTHEYYFGDWLFLYYIAKNLDNYVFKELLEQLAHDLEERREARYRQQIPTLEEEPLKKN